MVQLVISANKGLRTIRSHMGTALRNDRNARDRMYLHPFSVKRILNQRSDDSDMRSYSGDIYLIRKSLAPRLRVSLLNWEFANQFEYQIAVLGAQISRIKQVLELGVQFEPPVSVAIGFVADSIRSLPIRGINNRARDRDALLLHDQTTRMVDVRP